MEQSPDLVIETARCAPFHLALAADPIGSAGSYDGFLCVEVPGPWQRDMSLHEPYHSLMAGSKALVGADGRHWRPQGLRCDGTSGRRTVLAFDRGPARSDAVGGAYRRRQWSVAHDEVVDLCRGLLLDDGSAAGHSQDRVEVDEDVVDLLVCTHGRRDVCCGSLGTTLHGELTTALADEPGVRLWRTSHTGGHRFAPTALTFPDGYGWAHLDVRTARHLVRREVDPSELASSCRGLSSLDGAPSQTADRAALVEVGWRWLDAERSVTVTAFRRDTLATMVRVVGRWPDGSVCGFDVCVEVERHVPQSTCGALDSPSYGTEPVWRAASIDRVDQGSLGAV